MGNLNHRSRPTSIETLPDEILVKIIGYVPIIHWCKLERVSHKIRDATLEAWKKLMKIHIHDELLRGHVHLNEDNPARKKFRQSRRSLGEERLVTILDGLLRRAPNLVEIDGLLCPVDPLKIVRPLLSCVVLNRLARFEKLRRIIFDSKTLDYQRLCYFLARSASLSLQNELEVIWPSVHRWSEPESSGLIAAPADRPGPNRHFLVKTINYEDQYRSWWQDSYSLLLGGDVSGLSAFVANVTVAPMKCMANLFEHAKNLERLSFVFDCRYDNDKAVHGKNDLSVRITLATNKRIIDAIGNMPTLKSLTMRADTLLQCECRKFDAELTKLFRSLRKREAFEELRLDAAALFDPQLIEATAPELPRLKSLGLRLMHLDKAALNSILRFQPDLQCLRLQDFFGDTCFDATDLLGNSNLEYLILKFPFKEFQKADLLSLCHLSKLRSFRLCGYVHISNGVDDSVLEAWARSFGSTLRKFELPNSSNLSNRGVVSLVKSAPHLRELVLGRCFLNDDGLKEIALLHPKIEKLALCRCNGVTEKGLNHVIQGFGRLKDIYVSSTNLKVRKVKAGKYRRAVNIYIY